MKSVVIHAEGSVRVEERPLPFIQAADDVLVRVICSGLCGSDIPRIFAKGAHYYPITLGHEFSGYVEACGTDVADLKVGDGVACVPLLPCFSCPECEKGYYSLCKHYQFVGSRSEGGNAEYVVVKRANLFRLPETMTIEDGAFIEPITVGLHAFHLASGCEGKNVIIVGAGTIGLLAMQCALALGASSVTAIDINDEKLALASRLGATRVFNSRSLSADDIFSALSESRFDQLVLETAGTPQTVTLAIDIAGPRAQLALVGTLHHDLHLPAATFGKILRKELTLLGSWMNYSAPWPGEEWEMAARLLADKKLQLAPLVAHSGDSESFAQAVQALNGSPMQGKIMLRFA
ncbi:galactitol-1-phosphate 5-dehydrogenase [Enterobacter hormaechei]|uniref:Galactitol-1-phosphate 5-dehydrogenase n=1 Tax=Enterobacter hormaechei TaxID=158836 RepID=A0AAW8ZHR9_9ENTR|nr:MULTISPECIES: galactitol-1-phosphate 5-dehydrogenase [Enterobacter cloacae complex]UAS94009.1 galactitol-1-phosphate 5-dehydrogenase [Enterobacter cloacae complex sp.]AJB72483.1 galactitol-1-phosphate 5-dehydrogenase [Enterobacter hormaechei subsp. hormaechei]EGK57730.1 galactitol-1-phosphate 5-dehydrogenase [Enterobacter hormaechei ATCC 49162]EGQ5281024.1 galactitol-1-phosphate 5-dehydrogenase [Enterobacter hormaechei]EGQ5285775.1 galactitol-1-phosphate 5-dehydrogenase [Enterobacter hormae